MVKSIGIGINWSKGRFKWGNSEFSNKICIYLWVIFLKTIGDEMVSYFLFSIISTVLYKENI